MAGPFPDSARELRVAGVRWCRAGVFGPPHAYNGYLACPLAHPRDEAAAVAVAEAHADEVRGDAPPCAAGLTAAGCTAAGCRRPHPFTHAQRRRWAAALVGGEGVAEGGECGERGERTGREDAEGDA